MVGGPATRLGSYGALESGTVCTVSKFIANDHDSEVERRVPTVRFLLWMLHVEGMCWNESHGVR